MFKKISYMCELVKAIHECSDNGRLPLNICGHYSHNIHSKLCLTVDIRNTNKIVHVKIDLDEYPYWNVFDFIAKYHTCLHEIQLKDN